MGVGQKNVSLPLLIFLNAITLPYKPKKVVPGGGKYPTTPPWKLGPKPQNHPFQQIFYISIIASLEPKLLVFKSSTQQQSCKANKIGQFCHQDRPSICLGSKVRDRAITAFHLGPFFLVCMVKLWYKENIRSGIETFFWPTPIIPLPYQLSSFCWFDPKT